MQIEIEDRLTIVFESVGQLKDAERHQLAVLNACRKLVKNTGAPKWVERLVRTHLRLGRLCAFQEKPFKHHWETGLSLSEDLLDTEQDEQVVALRQELKQLRGQWLNSQTMR